MNTPFTITKKIRVTDVIPINTYSYLWRVMTGGLLNCATNSIHSAVSKVDPYPFTNSQKNLLNKRYLEFDSRMSDIVCVKRKKDKLRTCMKSTLRQLHLLEKDKQSKCIHRMLINDHRFRVSKRVFLYLSTKNEIDTIPIFKSALEMNKICYTPLVIDTRTTIERKEQFDTRMIMVKLQSIEELDQLCLNKFGIKEKRLEQVDESDVARPANPEQSPSSDLFLIPGVAFTNEGDRLGHGKGYYDEFLNNWSKVAANKTSFNTIGLAFKEQIVSDTHSLIGSDFKLDQVLFCDIERLSNE